VSLKIKTIMAEVRSRFESFYGPGLIKIMLYGSHARGDAEPGSDIDILVVLRGPVDSGEMPKLCGNVNFPWCLSYEISHR
jgi:predicted nucleotidyltransferase